MMRQYRAIREEAGDALLFFRLGDFYELFFEDAVTASGVLGITLTSRQKERGEAIPMCGVPYHAADGYIARLLARGYKIAICDQTEPAQKGGKLVAREITRIVTPGTLTDPRLLTSGENNFLLGILEREGVLGSAFLDVSTGEFRAFQASDSTRWEDLGLRIAHFSPREVVFPRPDSGQVPEIEKCVRSPLDAWVFDPETASRELMRQFGTRTLEGFGIAGQAMALGAAGALIHYARQTQKTSLSHISGLRFETAADFLHIDASSIRNLELLDPASASGDRRHTLIGVLDRTRTGMGARRMRQWMLRPSISPSEIRERQQAVGELVSGSRALGDVIEAFDGVLDMERLLSRVTLGSATPRELTGLRASFRRLPAIGEAIAALEATRWRSLAASLDPLDDLHTLLADSIAEEPPTGFADGGVIRTGYDAGLDQLRRASIEGKEYLAGLERRERERTGIGSLKVRFNRVFGYYIEVSRANLHLVPDDYVRKQTLVGAERFITEELKNHEERILAAEERMVAMEREIFLRVTATLAEAAPRVRDASAVVAETDVLAALADLARRFGYTLPELSDDAQLVIRNGRHPVLEALAEENQAERFVPNDLFMDAEASLIHLVTGPNMGGKSTFLRQNALILIMAHMGAWVPAGFARFPILDRIFTRIGASDDLARGRSTFMVEMTEAAIILNSATSNSLVILDEIGRGTATFDGLSIAWAVVEYISRQIGARTLFATHYHELTVLAESLPGVRNFHVTVRKSGDGILFLRKIAPGPAAGSYGIEVARLAGIPASVVGRAREILEKHEASGRNLSDDLSPRASRDNVRRDQLALFSPAEEELRRDLARIDIDRTSPLEALRILADLKKKSGRS